MRRALAVAAALFISFPAAPAAGQARAGDALRLALVVPIAGPPLYTSEGTRAADAVRRVDSIARALDRLLVPELDAIPIALAPSPVLCDELRLLRFGPGERPDTKRVLEAIAALSVRRSPPTRLVVSPYADVRLTDLPSSAAVRRQLLASPEACTERDRDIVLAPDLAIDTKAVRGAVEAGATIALAAPAGDRRGPVRMGGLTLIPTAVVSGTDTPNDAYLRLQEHAAAAALLPAGREDLATFIGALANDPRIELVGIREAGMDAPAGRVGFAAHDDPPDTYARSLASATTAWHELRSFTRPTDRTAALVRTLVARASSSAEWDGEWTIGRKRARDAVRVVERNKRLVTAPEGSVTFTSQRGSVPVTVRNGNSFPARVRIELSSTKLEFPAGSSRTLTVEPPGDTVVFSALARSTGTFPVHVRLTSPDGRVVFSASGITVRSTAANVAGLALTAGAAVFFAVWLIRSLRRRRREPLAAR